DRRRRSSARALELDRLRSAPTQGLVECHDVLRLRTVALGELESLEEVADLVEGRLMRLHERQALAVPAAKSPLNGDEHERSPTQHADREPGGEAECDGDLHCRDHQDGGQAEDEMGPLTDPIYLRSERLE